ncbi:MazG-like family protein [Clostridium paraputrificum]|uniref:MazG-like family protein n=1 Tax=Clostridium TaxID=1485 RepID=UPI003D33ABA6
MKHKELNIMANVKIIENLKAQLLCIVGEFFRLLTKGTNVAQDAIIDCISGAIIILYVLGEKLGYSLSEIDHTMKNKLDMGIKAEDEVEKDGKSLSELKSYISKRRD